MTTMHDDVFSDEIKELVGTVARLEKDASAKTVLLTDRNGQLLACAGDADQIDAGWLPALVGEDPAAVSAATKELRDGGSLAVLPRQGQPDHAHVQIAAERFLLAVVFDDRSSLGLVRLRARKAAQELNRTCEELAKKASAAGGEAVFGEITDADIGAFFQN